MVERGGCATGDSQIPQFLDFQIPTFPFGLYLARSTHRQEFSQLTLTNCFERVVENWPHVHLSVLWLMNTVALY